MGFPETAPCKFGFIFSRVYQDERTTPTYNGKKERHPSPWEKPAGKDPFSGASSALILSKRQARTGQGSVAPAGSPPEARERSLKTRADKVIGVDLEQTDLAASVPANLRTRMARQSSIFSRRFP